MGPELYFAQGAQRTDACAPTYDGFGNLTDRTLIKGTAPDVHVAYDPATNRRVGDTADLNGNIGVGYIYDLENRLVQPGRSSTARYAYDASNHRVWRGDTGANPVVDEIAFWGGSQKLATYQISTSGGLSFTVAKTNVYFGGKLISKGTYNPSGTGDKVTLAPVAADRLGSIGKFYPYGTERPSATQNDTEKFTGYFRDASTGLDYADQRYHQPGTGRFMTPDAAPSASGTDPGSWNRYAYTRGDPVNRVDPNGTTDECAETFCVTGTGYLDAVSGVFGGGGGPGSWPAHLEVAVSDEDRIWQLALFSRRMQSLYALFAPILKNSASAFAEQIRNGDIPGDCQQDLFKLVDNLGVDLVKWTNALDNVSILLGPGSTDAQAPTLPAGDPAIKIATDRNLTIGSVFNDKGTSAYSSANDNRVWINPTLINPLLSSGLIAHEALHNIGFTDVQIQAALGLKVDPQNTKNITDQFSKDCFGGLDGILLQ
jgi:RHS repeat-associated protein